MPIPYCHVSGAILCQMPHMSNHIKCHESFTLSSKSHTVTSPVQYSLKWHRCHTLSNAPTVKPCQISSVFYPVILSPCCHILSAIPCQNTHIPYSVKCPKCHILSNASNAILCQITQMYYSVKSPKCHTHSNALNAILSNHPHVILCEMPHKC